MNNKNRLMQLTRGNFSYFLCSHNNQTIIIINDQHFALFLSFSYRKFTHFHVRESNSRQQVQQFVGFSFSLPHNFKPSTFQTENGLKKFNEKINNLLKFTENYFV